MDEKVYRQILRMMALERWENEGGKVISNESRPDRTQSPETKTNGGEGHFQPEPHMIQQITE